VLGDSHVLSTATDAAELHSSLRAGEIDLLVVDPSMREGVFAGAVEETIVRHPALPVVVYTTLTPDAMRMVVRMGRLGVQHVVLNRFDDEPRRFQELLERVPAQPLAELMLQELAEQLRLVPIVVARAIEQLFRSPARVRSVQELARMAGMIPRTFYRQLEPVGLQPRELLVCARLLRVYVLLREPEPRLKEIALKLGYAEPGLMSEQLRAWTGVSPREIRRTITAERFVKLLTERLRHSESRLDDLTKPA
jgi:AraC-like DNA-binding protein